MPHTNGTPQSGESMGVIIIESEKLHKDLVVIIFEIVLRNHLDRGIRMTSRDIDQSVAVFELPQQ